MNQRIEEHGLNTMEPAKQTRGGAVVHCVIAFGLIGLGLFIHRDNFGYGLVGNDTYPQILTSRVDSLADFWDNFREPLAEGYLEASFYRPVQSMSIALDERLGGLDPRGYQHTTLAVFAACIAVLYATLRKLGGGEKWAAPLVGTLFFIMHPALLSVLPAPCRRAELFVGLFLLAALLVLPDGSEQRRWPRCLLAGFFVLLACGSKEIGAMGCGLVFLHQLFFTRERGFGRKALASGKAASPAIAGVMLYLLVRSTVLGGWGGYHFDDPEPFLELLPRWCGQLAVDALCPWAFIDGLTPVRLAYVPLTILGLLGLGFGIGGLCGRSSQWRRIGALLLLGSAWIVPLVLVLGLNQLYGPWYALMPVVGLALLVGGLAYAVERMLVQRGLTRILGALVGILLLAALVVPLGASPLWTEYSEWATATRLLAQTQERIDETLAGAAVGTRVSVLIPVRVTQRAPDGRPFRAEGEQPRLYGVVIFKYEGVSAWLKLRYPERKIRLEWGPRRPLPEPDPDEVLLLAYPDRTVLRR